MIFWILIALGVLIATVVAISLANDGDSDAVPSWFAIVIATALVVFIYSSVASIATSGAPTSTKVTSYDLVSFSEYGGGEAGGLYATVGGDSDTVSFVLDGKLMQESEDNVTILTSDRVQVEKVTGKIRHPSLYPWTQSAPDTYTLYLPQTAVDFTNN